MYLLLLLFVLLLILIHWKSFQSKTKSENLRPLVIRFTSEFSTAS